MSEARSLIANQSEFREKGNQLVDAYQKKGSKIKKLNEDGNCAGLSLNYVAFAKEKRWDEFYRNLEVINSLTEENIQKIVDEDLPHLKFKASFDEHEEHIALDRLRKFINIISEAQSNPEFKILGGNYDRSYLLFCQPDKLAKELKDARIAESQFIFADLGKHVFVIEKADNGFYLFEPNRLNKKSRLSCSLLKSEKEVANAIYKNLLSYDYLSDNENIALMLNFISFGDENREIDHLLSTFNVMLNDEKLENQFLTIKSLMSDYNEKKIARNEIAKLLYDYLCEFLIKNKNCSEKLINFKIQLEQQIHKEKILIDYHRMIKQLNKETINDTAYCKNITRLYLAVRNNQITLVKNLLDKGANPNQANALGIASLHLAVLLRYVECLILLLSHPAINPNLEDPHGWTALNMTVAKGNVESLKLLLSHPAINPNQATDDGWAPLHKAAKNGNAGYVKLLLSHPAINPDQEDMMGKTALYKAVEGGHLKCVKILLNYSTNEINKTFSHQNITLLYLAAQKGHLEIVKFLLKKGARWDIPIKASIKALLNEAEKNHQKNTIELLLKNAFNLDPIDGLLPDTLDGFNALHAAAFFGHIEIFKLFLDLDESAALNSRVQGLSALDFIKSMNHFYTAVREGKVENVITLLNFPMIDPNQTNSRGWAALHAAALTKENLECIKVLLQHPTIDINQTNAGGATAFYVASQNGCLEIARLLLEKNAKWDIPIKASIKILLNAAEKKRKKEKLELLLKNAFNSQPGDKLPDTLNNFNALHGAAFFGHIELIKLLFDAGADLYRTADGITALDFIHLMDLLYDACIQGKIDDVITLLNFPNINPNQGYKGLTPLCAAVLKGHILCVKALLMHPLTDPNQGIIPPLYIAIKTANLECVRLLLAACAKSEMPIITIQYLLDESEKMGKKEKLKLLLTKSINIEIENFSNPLHGFTPLHAAAFFGHVEILKLLIETGEDLNSEIHGLSAYDFAKGMNQEEIIRILKEQGAAPLFESRNQMRKIKNDVVFQQKQSLTFFVANKNSYSIDRIIKFFYVNVDFFAEPFISTDKFIQQNDLLFMQANRMMTALDQNRQIPFRLNKRQYEAILMQLFNNLANNLDLNIIYEDFAKTMFDFLKENKALVEVMNKIIDDRMKDNLIDSWYENKENTKGVKDVQVIRHMRARQIGYSLLESDLSSSLRTSIVKM